MKKLLLFLFVAALSAGFASCGSDDDDDNSKTNEFEYSVFKSQVANCYIQLDDDEFMIILVGKGVSINFENSNFSGTGSMLGISLYSKNKSIEGKYTVEGDDEELEKSIYRAYVLSIAGNTGSSPLEFDFGQGSEVSVKKSGETYEIIVTGHDDEGVAVSAYYKGAVTFTSIIK